MPTARVFCSKNIGFSKFRRLSIILRPIYVEEEKFSTPFLFGYRGFDAWKCDQISLIFMFRPLDLFIKNVSRRNFPGISATLIHNSDGNINVWTRRFGWYIFRKHAFHLVKIHKIYGISKHLLKCDQMKLEAVRNALLTWLFTFTDIQSISISR